MRGQIRVEDMSISGKNVLAQRVQVSDLEESLTTQFTLMLLKTCGMSLVTAKGPDLENGRP